MDDAILQQSKAGLISCRIEDILQALQHECGNGGRMEMLYARPQNGTVFELRYLVNHAASSRFVTIVCEVTDSAPSMAQHFPLLGWSEREITDLYGIKFQDHPQPYSLIRQERGAADSPLMENPDIQRLPFGPVRADVVESAEFTFYYSGESIIHYHPRLFFKHRGMERRFEGLTQRAGVVFAERVSGIGSFAHALAFAQACENAAGCVVPPRAQMLRTLLAELERIYNHLAYLGLLTDATTLKVGQAEGKLLAERAKQINGKLTGSRFLRSVVTPGGLRQDIELLAWFELDLDSLRAEAEWYVHLLLETNSFRDRLITTGHLDERTAYDQGATGPIARASGIDRELRRDHPYAGYSDLTVPVPVRQEGDADARFRVRVAELFASFDIVTALSRKLEPGPVSTACEPPAFSEGLGWAESPRGSLFYAVHFDNVGRFERVKIKSPSFSNWRVFPFTVHDSNMMDYAINEASFGLSIAGCDR
jgi:Ni,Fe-hydrogenase III large subunit